eukprot:g7789.t1
MNDNSPLLPPQLRGINGLSSTLCFQIPIVRHLWWWLDLRPASRESITSTLLSGKSAVLVPGGVREIQYVQRGKEVLFLKQRFGFVKLALQTGSPLLPVFAFGQTDTYSPHPIGPPLIPVSLTNALGRLTGVQPLFMLGRFGTTIPKRVPILVVIGTPIPVPKIANPDFETIQCYLQRFIDQMTELFEEYKAEAGFPELLLEVV